MNIRNKLLNIIISGLFATLMFCQLPVAQAQEAQPGDACVAGEAGWYRRSTMTTAADGGNMMICDGTNWVGFINYQSTGNLVLGTTGAVALPDGTDAQRPAVPIVGMIRFSSTSNTFEGYDGTVWGGLAAGGGGGAINDLSDAMKNPTDINLFLAHDGGSVGIEDDWNIGVGERALDSLDNSGADNNVAIGYLAMDQNRSGDNNVAIGRGALQRSTTGGNDNVAIGTFTANENAAGDRNIAIGGGAADFNQQGNNNVSVGYESGKGSGLHNMSHNVFIGTYAGSNVNGASNNVFIGYQAGNAITTGASNILMGVAVDAPTATTSNHMNIGDIIYASGVYNATAHIGIMNTSPDVELDVTGDIEYTGTITDMSDRRLKTDIAFLSGGQLAKITALEGVSFKMKNNLEAGTEFGFIAQDVQPLFPTLIYERGDDMLSMNYVGLIAPMVEAIKEQQALIESQNSRIETQQSQIDAQQSQIEALSARLEN